MAYGVEACHQRLRAEALAVVLLPKHNRLIKDSPSVGQKVLVQCPTRVAGCASKGTIARPLSARLLSSNYFPGCHERLRYAHPYSARPDRVHRVQYTEYSAGTQRTAVLRPIRDTPATHTQLLASTAVDRSRSTIVMGRLRAILE